jgi:hypothetical protein
MDLETFLSIVLAVIGIAGYASYRYFSENVWLKC